MIDRSTGHPRLLVSAQERRPERPEPLPDGIYSVDLEPIAGRSERVRRLELVGRDSCSFRPHGISLVEPEPAADSTPQLYVINKHDPKDLSTPGCVLAREPAKSGRQRPASVEVFEVRRDRLRFLQRLDDPAVLTNPNDLVARPDGTLWATNPVPGALRPLIEGLTGRNHGSHLVAYRCERRKDRRCSGVWERIEPDFGAYLNGIAYRDVGATAGELFVASTASSDLYVLTVADGEVRSIEPHRAVLGVDNLTWLDPAPGERHHLIAAAHPDLRRFGQHANSAQARSPSRALLLTPEPWYGPTTGDGEVRRSVLFEDDGRVLSAASVAVRYEDDLILGQVFEPGLLRCALSSADWSVGALRVAGGER